MMVYRSGGGGVLGPGRDRRVVRASRVGQARDAARGTGVYGLRSALCCMLRRRAGGMEVRRTWRMKWMMFGDAMSWLSCGKFGV